MSEKKKEEKKKETVVKKKAPAKKKPKTEQAKEKSPAEFLVDERVVFITGMFDTENEEKWVREITYHLMKDPTKPITLFINSYGGRVATALSLASLLSGFKDYVNTVCTGVAASAGAVLLSCGTPGHRYITPEASGVMIHSITAGTFGRVEDMKISVQHFDYVNKHLATLLSQNTRQPVDKLLEIMERDYWMSPDEALNFGIVDKKLWMDNIIADINAYKK